MSTCFFESDLHIPAKHVLFKKIKCIDLNIVGKKSVRLFLTLDANKYPFHGDRHMPIAVKWVLVRIEGKKKPHAFFTNDVEIDALDLLKQYMLRWNVEVTFEEARAHVGVETQRQWSDLAIARTTPVLFGLFSLITCAALHFYRNGELTPQSSAWYKKPEITFSDLIAVMRRKTWGRKYLNSEKSPQQKLFSQDDIQVLIDQLLGVA